MSKAGEPEKFDSFKYISINELNKHKLSFNMQNLLLEIKTDNIVFQ